MGKRLIIDRRALILLALTFVIGGIFGFVYEEIFYCIDLGYLVKRGSTWGPWIPIYGFGAVGIVLVAYRFKRNPLVLTLVACLLTGGLELITGCVLFHCFDGLRLWDYNVEIWNWGNIGGYICFRSVAFFAVSALAFCYLIYPLLEKFYDFLQDRRLEKLCYVPCALFLLDIVGNLVVKILH